MTPKPLQGSLCGTQQLERHFMQWAPGCATGKVATQVHLPKAKTTQGPWAIFLSQACGRSPPRPNWRCSVSLGDSTASPEAHGKPPGTTGTV